MIFLTTLALLIATPASAGLFGASFCGPLLGGEDPLVLEAGAKVESVVDGLFNSKFEQLTNLFRAESIDVVVVKGNGKAPFARAHLPTRKRPKRVLEVRNLSLDTPLDRDRSTWVVARALFDFALNERLKTQPPDKSPRQTAEWQAEHLAALVPEIYGVLDGLNEIAPADVLRRADPGRPWTRLQGLFTAPAKRLRPNLDDYMNFWKKGGKEALGPALVERYKEALVFAERRRVWQQRAATLAAAFVVAGGFWYSSHSSPPPPPPPPSAHQYSAPEDLSPEAKRDSELSPAERLRAQQDLRRFELELERLHRASTLQQPRTTEIEQIKELIRKHKAKYPFLLLPTAEPS